MLRSTLNRRVLSRTIIYQILYINRSYFHYIVTSNLPSSDFKKL